MEKQGQRNFKMDNIKAVLIFLVVFGHMLELFSGGNRIYRLIYSFHMPAFIFITGYYARFKPRKILLELAVPYVVFQTLYQIFNAIGSGDAVNLQYTTPYELLWYLLTMISHYLLLPLIKADNGKKKLWIIILAIIISLLAGYDSTIGSYMSLSRTLVFLPFFVAGHYIGDSCDSYILIKKWYAKAAALFGLVLASAYIVSDNVSSAMLTGANSYGAAGYGILKRAVLLAIAGIWVLAMFNFVPNIKIPLFSVLGQGTLAIYLLHGLVQRLLGRISFFDKSLKGNLIYAVLVSALIVIAFGNLYFSRLFNLIVKCRWLRKPKYYK